MIKEKASKAAGCKLLAASRWGYSLKTEFLIKQTLNERAFSKWLLLRAVS
jgi:hypothetical protein